MNAAAEKAAQNVPHIPFPIFPSGGKRPGLRTEASGFAVPGAALAALLFFLMLLALPFSPARGQELANFSGAFADVGFGARALGMGQAHVALAEGPEALAWNVAGISRQQGLGASFSYAKQFGLIPYAFFGLTLGHGGFGLGVGGIYSGDDLLRESTILLGGAGELLSGEKRLEYGLLLSLYSASFGPDGSGTPGISGSAFGYGLSLGLKYFPARRIVLATSLKNLATSVTWQTSGIGRYRQGLPAEWTVGVGLLDLTGLNFELDLRKSLYRDIQDQFFVGAELPVYGVMLRAGSGNSLQQGRRLFYTVGAGVQQSFNQNHAHFALDIAYILHPLANMLRLSFSLRLQ